MVMPKKRYTPEEIVQHLRTVEQENLRLKRIVADQALDLSIVKEVALGNF